MADDAKLTRGSIAGHLVAQTTPLMLGVAAIISVGLADAYFLGQLGSAELAAIGFVFPVTTALASLGVGVIAGVSSVVSRALGEGNQAKAHGLANLGVVLGFAAGVLIAGLLLLGREPLFRLMQAEPALLPLIDAYMWPYALGFPLLLTMMGMNGVLRGQGAAGRSTAILLAYAAVNLALDPLLILGGLGVPAMGIAGAGYATLGGWAAGLAVAIVLMQTGAIPFDPRALARCAPRRGLAALARVAGPAAFSSAISPAGLAVLTALLAAEGQAAVAGFGAGGRLQTFAVVPLLGLSSAIGAIVGQNWGAGEYRRARLAMLQSGLFCLVYGLGAGMVLFAGRNWFAAQFGEDAAVAAATARYLAIAVWGYVGYGVLIVVAGAFNAIDRAGTALALSLARVLVLLVPLALLLRPSLGADAIYWAELAANLAGGLVAALLAALIFRNTRKSTQLPVAPSSA